VITRRLTAAAWLLFGATAGAAPDADPDYLITTWQTDQGLPENSATSMVQTPDGYLWFGTFNGLVRFDGVRFDVFDTANTPPLPSAEIVSLHLDRRGRLWVSTPMGMACVKDGVWKVLQHGQGWSGNYARFFAEHADGRLYVGTFDDKLLELSGESFHEVPFPHPPVEARSGIRPHFDEAGVLWAVTDHFVGRLQDAMEASGCFRGSGCASWPAAAWCGKGRVFRRPARASCGTSMKTRRARSG
jgi:ligand-binding sensor domain-containing protein